MKAHKHKCGCVSEVGDRERWISMCAEHEAEFQAIHQRWAEEHKAKQTEEQPLLKSDLKRRS